MPHAGYYTAFIDWNGDGDFDNAEEEVLRKNTVSTGVSVQVTVPASAKTGVTRLRVAVQKDKYAGACESFSVGEVEDYLVCIGGGGTTPPPASSITLTCPADITAPQIADYGADVFIPQPTASTTCAQGGLTLTYSPALPANRTPHFPVGTTTVTVTAKDACGNTKTCTFKVIVTPRPIDNGKLTLTCPADQTFQVTAGEQHATVNFPLPTASTTCPKGGLALTQTAGPARGSRQGAGTYTVTYRATDDCGNAETCSFKVVVKAVPVEACDDRSKNGLIALYEFETGSGTTVFDRSGFGTPLNLHLDLGKVNWLGGDCGIEIKQSTLIQSATSAAKIVHAVKQTNEITIEAWVQANNLHQDGPARIVTISENPHLRNVTLGQEKTEYVARLRTTHTDHNGMPDFESGHDRVKTQVQHVVYTRNSAGHERFYVDGILVKSGTRGGNLSGWVDHNRLILGNEASGDRPWLGKLYKVAIYQRDLSAAEVQTHFNVGKCCKAPVTPPTANCDKDILFVVGNTSLNSGDRAVREKLISYGYQVTVKDPHQVKTSDADGKGLVIISSTVSSSDVGTKFTHVSTPVLTWEAYLYDELKMTGATAEHDYGSGWGYTKLVSKVDHPINRDVRGTRTVVTHTEDFRFGKPASSATIVAVAENMHDKPVIFTYEAGDQMVGKTAPGKRIGWFFDDDTAVRLTADGWIYFRNAVAWATGCTSSGLRIEAPVMLFADATYATVDLKWATTLRDGEDAFVLEHEDAAGNWTELAQFEADVSRGGPTTVRYADAAPTLGVNRYRVIALSPTGQRESNVAEVLFTQASDISVYPNPATETAYVVLEGLTGFDVDVQVINALGQVMLQRRVLDATEAPFALEVGHLPEGSYIVHVQTDAVRYSKPLVLVK